MSLPSYGTLPSMSPDTTNRVEHLQALHSSATPADAPAQPPRFIAAATPACAAPSSAAAECQTPKYAIHGTAHEGCTFTRDEASSEKMPFHLSSKRGRSRERPSLPSMAGDSSTGLSSPLPRPPRRPFEDRPEDRSLQMRKQNAQEERKLYIEDGICL